MGTRFLRRQAALLEWTLASLGKRAGKTAVLLVVLTLAVFLLGSLAFFRASFRLEASEMLRESPDMVIQRMAAGRLDPVPSTAADTVRALPGVADARARRWGYYYDPATKANFTVAVPLSRPLAEEEAAIGCAVSRSRSLFPGDLLYMRSYGGEPVFLEVKSVLPAGADFVAADTVLVSDEDFRLLFSLPPDQAIDIVVRLSPGADPRAVREGVLRAIPGARVVTREEIRATAASFLDVRNGMAAVLVLATSLALLIVCADKPSAAGGDEGREMGILRAIGWSRSEVLAAKVWESLAVSFVALSAGMLAAYAHVYLFRGALFAALLRGWAAISPDLSPVPAFDVPFLAAVAAAVVLLPAAGALLSARRAVTGDPDTAIRG
ncbi:MAG: FtsX-like permease family protein [Thermodesulfobacteriota bacterium]